MLNAISGISLNSVWLAAVFLLSLRIGAIFLMTPVMAVSSIPPSIRVLLILGLSAAITIGSTLSVSDPSYIRLAELIGHPARLIQAGFTELALGTVLALGIHMAFAAASVAGRLLDIQIGFGIGQVFDPLSNSQVPILTTAFNQIALIIFFLINGHHALMRGIFYSLERFPLGQPWPLDAVFGTVIKQVAGLFSVAFALAAPVVFCILLVEMVLGVLARNLPQMNMLAMGIPIKIVVGLVALAIWFSGIGSVMGRIYSGIYTTWDAAFSVPDFSADTGAKLPAGTR